MQVVTKTENMTTSKANSSAPPNSQPNNNTIECCMCGDYGFSYELFQCKLCHFRSQHRYCSNLYPNAESYRICNWCLSQKEDSKEKSQNSSNSSSSCKNDAVEDNESPNNIKKKSLKQQQVSQRSLGVSMHLQLNGPIKKQRSIEIPPPSPSPSPSPSLSPPVSVSTRKRIITNSAKEKKLRRTGSEDISSGGITKQVFRNKVRRYKLLDEVSS